MPASFDKSKRSVVKHKTHKPFTAGQGSSSDTRTGGRSGARGGFKVGPSHAPDGAYLGKAKKIKANLIANAKTKKRFFKSIAKDGVDAKGKGRERDGQSDVEGERGTEPSSPSTAATSRFFQKPSLGRFAREGEEEEEIQGPSVDSRRTQSAGTVEVESRQRRRDRAGPIPKEDPPQRKRSRIDSITHSQTSSKPLKLDTQDDKMTAPPKPLHPHRTRDEAIAARKKRQDMWNSATKGGPRNQSRKGGQPDLGKRMQVLLGKIEGNQ